VTYETAGQYLQKEVLIGTVPEESVAQVIHPDAASAQFETLEAH
jgi:hypothetical protein